MHLCSAGRVRVRLVKCHRCSNIRCGWQFNRCGPTCCMLWVPAGEAPSWGRHSRVPTHCNNVLEPPVGCTGAANQSWEQQEPGSVSTRPKARGEREQCASTGLCSLPPNRKDEIIEKPRSVCQARAARLPFSVRPARQEQRLARSCWHRGHGCWLQVAARVGTQHPELLRVLSTTTVRAPSEPRKAFSAG